MMCQMNLLHAKATNFLMTRPMCLLRSTFKFSRVLVEDVLESHVRIQLGVNSLQFIQAWLAAIYGDEFLRAIKGTGQSWRVDADCYSRTTRPIHMTCLPVRSQ